LIETTSGFVVGANIQSDSRDAAVGKFLHYRGKDCASDSLATVRRMAKNVADTSDTLQLIDQMSTGGRN
jgi:hypothetical protein